MANYIHLIRHGITEGNLKQWFYGAADIPLCEEGRTELARLRDLGIYPFSDTDHTSENITVKYFTSGLIRAEESFEIIYGQRPHEVLSGFREMDYGSYECKSYQEMAHDPEFLHWLEDDAGISNPHHGESRKEFRHRARVAFRNLMIRQERESQDRHEQDMHYVVVCHGGTIAVIMFKLFVGEHPSPFQWVPDPGRGYTVKIKDLSVLSYTDI